MLGVVGKPLQHEVNFLAYDAFVTQQARIQKAVDDNLESQNAGLRDFLDQHGKGMFGNKLAPTGQNVQS